MTVFRGVPMMERVFNGLVFFFMLAASFLPFLWMVGEIMGWWR
jgi:hypothetical protein